MLLSDSAVLNLISFFPASAGRHLFSFPLPRLRGPVFCFLVGPRTTSLSPHQFLTLFFGSLRQNFPGLHPLVVRSFSPVNVVFPPFFFPPVIPFLAFFIRFPVTLCGTPCFSPPIGWLPSLFCWFVSSFPSGFFFASGFSPECVSLVLVAFEPSFFS